jgi:regulator of sigma E protease
LRVPSLSGIITDGSRAADMLLSILAFIVVLGITITIHEFGHFAMAKLLRIRVLVFSIGFGPRLAGFTRGGTEYRLSPIPLGGYVKMAGETFDEEREGAPDEFLSHPKWHRFLVAVSGPLMNVMLAIAIFAVIHMQGMVIPRYLGEPALVGPVNFNSIAYEAGLISGDRVLTVEGNPVSTWQDMEIALATAPRGPLNIMVQRGRERIPLRLEYPEADAVDSIALGFKYTLPRTLIADIIPDTPAQRAGMQAGDEILSVRSEAKAGSGYGEILNIISESEGVPLNFEIRRPSRAPEPDASWESAVSAVEQSITTLQVTLTPEADTEGRAVIGFFPRVPYDDVQHGFGGAIVSSVRHNYEMAALTFKIIGRIFTGTASIRTISGPIEIARLSGDVAQSAARTGSARFFIGFVGMVSLQLGIFNLLPIPILDGGVITLLLVEGIIGRDLSLRIKEKIVQVGFVFLILLMGFVVFNDLSKIVDFEKLFR